MSQNISAIHDALDALNRRDKATWHRLCDPDVENFPPRDWPESEVLRGADAIWDFFVGATAAWDGAAYRWIEVIEAGPHKLVAHQGTDLKGKSSGVQVAWSFWVVFTFRDGKVVRLEWFADRIEALEAAGLAGWSMSGENLEIVRRAIDAWERRDRAAWRLVHHPELKVFPDRSFVGSTEMVAGREAAWAYYVEINEPFESNPIRDVSITEAGPDKVLIHHRMVPRGRSSGVELVADAWDLVTIMDGQIVSERWFFERGDALRAAGLSE